MFFRKRRTLWLVKANNNFISWCRCDDAPIAWGQQLDCPWCGCGWLFSCLKCRKSFTFARAVLMKETIQELAARDVAVWRPRTPLDSAEGKEAIEQWISEMNELL